MCDITYCDVNEYVSSNVCVNHVLLEQIHDAADPFGIEHRECNIT